MDALAHLEAVDRVCPNDVTGAARDDITVALIVHGEPPHLRRVVEAVLRQQLAPGRIRVLCLDDGTSPRARATLHGMDVHIVDLPHGASISTAKNEALRLSKDEYLFFLDDHILLEPGSIQAAIETFRLDPRIAGVCGFYRSSRDSDWNTLRDIKRHSIYGKSTQRRLITLDAFTTFSTGIGIVRRGLFGTTSFPEDVFPPDYGGEDVPALIQALNEGHIFAYEPRLSGRHEHDLTLRQFLKKMEVEVRGRFCVFYWASGAPKLVVPYLHGFLNVPVFLCLASGVALIATLAGHPRVILLPGALLAFECALCLRCLSTPIRYKLGDRLLAALYVLASDLLTLLCGLQYLVSSYKRPYPRFGLRRGVTALRLFVSWELAKIGLRDLRSNVSGHHAARVVDLGAAPGTARGGPNEGA